MILYTFNQNRPNKILTGKLNAMNMVICINLKEIADKEKIPLEYLINLAKELTNNDRINGTLMGDKLICFDRSDLQRILSMVAMGKTSKQIADEMGTNEETIDMLLNKMKPYTLSE